MILINFCIDVFQQRVFHRCLVGVCGTHGAMGNSSVPQDGLGDKRQINGLLQEKQRGREGEREKKQDKTKVVSATKGKPR